MATEATVTNEIWFVLTLLLPINQAPTLLELVHQSLPSISSIWQKVSVPGQANLASESLHCLSTPLKPSPRRWLLCQPGSLVRDVRLSGFSTTATPEFQDSLCLAHFLYTEVHIRDYGREQKHLKKRDGGMHAVQTIHAGKHPPVHVR